MHPNPTFLLYGATGFTGRLVAIRAAELGLPVVLGGRSAGPVEALAASLKVPHRVFALEDAAAMDAAVAESAVVLNCSGPFSKTARPVVESCLRTRRHYVDITGEVDVLEAIFARHGEAVAAEVMLLPGAGFDVVPTDCLARHLKKRLPTATKLTLAFRAATRISPGTAATLIERMDQPGLVRRGGALVPIPAGSLRRDIDAGHGDRFQAMAIPWGDIASAWRSTGIPDIEVYTATSFVTRLGFSASRVSWLAPLIRGLIRFTSTGPGASLRRKGRALVWGEVADASGRRASTRLETPEPYALTVETALAAVQRILAGDAPPGAQTPAMAYGSDFVLGVPGVKREDLSP